MSDEKPRRKPGQPPPGDEKMGRLAINLPLPILATLTTEAKRRGVSRSALTRIALTDWMRRELPIGAMPHEPAAEEAAEADGERP